MAPPKIPPAMRGACRFADGGTVCEGLHAAQGENILKKIRRVAATEVTGRERGKSGENGCAMAVNMNGEMRAAERSAEGGYNFRFPISN